MLPLPVLNRPRSTSLRRYAGLLACAFLLAGDVGCTLFRNAGTGTRMDTPRDQPVSKNGGKKRDMLVEITTDPSGAVVSIVFKRSSGSDIVDARVADTIHAGFPRVPSTVTLEELTFSIQDGFSQPRTISTHPAP